MVDAVNLNKARKAKRALEAAARAAENRVVFGRSKAVKSATDLERRKADRLLEGVRREP